MPRTAASVRHVWMGFLCDSVARAGAYQLLPEEFFCFPGAPGGSRHAASPAKSLIYMVEPGRLELPTSAVRLLRSPN